MKIPLDKFEDWLRNKNLKERTVENYIYYFNKFTDEVFTQESVSRFLADKTNRNSVGRSFLINFQKFLKVNYRELGFSQESRLKITEVELPKLTGRVKQTLITPIPHEQIAVLEKFLETEQLKLELLISYYCALRLGELLKITGLSFNWEIWGKDKEKMGECRVFGKGDKEGIALIPSFLMKRIGKWIQGRNWKDSASLSDKLFVRDSADIDVKNRARLWQMRLREAGIRSGITKVDSAGKPIKETVVHPHRLRHSYASYLINDKGMDIRKVQEVLHV